VPLRHFCMPLKAYSPRLAADPSPRRWGRGIPPPDADGQCTWRVCFDNYISIYIRSQPIPTFAPGTPSVLALQISTPLARVALTTTPFYAGLWTTSPNGSDIFIPQSLLRFEIRMLDPMDPPACPMLPTPSYYNVPTVLCKLFPKIRTLQFHLCRVFRTHTNRLVPLPAPSSNNIFQGRRCKRCQGHHVHDPRCPSLRPGYECGWCLEKNGSHTFNCNGFVP
jgi:hypothetical protein